jgi:hypothetical protein
MTQMISSLETQNGIMKDRLKSLPTTADSLSFNESETCLKRKHSDTDQESKHQGSSLRQRNPTVSAIIEESKRDDDSSSIPDLPHVLGPLHKLNKSKSYPVTYKTNLGPPIEPSRRQVSEIKLESFHTNHSQTIPNYPNKFLSPLSQFLLRDSNNVQSPPRCSYPCSTVTAPDVFGAL